MSDRHEGSQKLARIQLVARTCMAWELVRDASRRGDVRSATPACTRLALLNRSLALLALQG
jgi:hypothetical protein